MLPEVSSGSPRNEEFLLQVPEIEHFADVSEPRFYVDVPDDFYVVLTDVRGSTRAIEQGRYRDVNAVGVASIVAIRNAIPDLELPYVFGGDGATLLVPESHREICEAALRGASERLIPILMTALVTALGLLPLAIGAGEAGREIEGPMAIVILGGLITSTLLNLLVLPTLAVRFGRFEKIQSKL